MGGDTIDDRTDLGFRIGWTQRLRFYGVDTYEPDDLKPAKLALAVEGKAFVAARVEGKEVVIHTYRDRGDKYGRWLAVVYYLGEDGVWRDLNRELVSHCLSSTGGDIVGRKGGRSERIGC